MAQRRSVRSTQPTQKVLASQAVDTARQQQKDRESARLADRVPFHTRGQQHASSLQRGEEPQEDDSSEDEEDELVDEEQQRQQQQSGPSKAKKPRVTRKGKVDSSSLRYAG